MGAGRADPFGDDLDLSDFKPTSLAKPKVSKEEIREVSEQTGFPSRKVPPMPTGLRVQRRRRTGRSMQLNIKVTPETAARFTRIADAKGWVQGELLEKALDALEREMESSLARSP
jgi:hypothetical protein